MEPLTALRPMIDTSLRTLSGRGAPLAPPTPPPAPIAPSEIEGLGTPVTGATSAPGSFESVLVRMVDEVNGKQVASARMTNQLLSGENVPLHRVMIAAEEAGVSFQLMVEVRNKLMDAYHELMRMQV